MGARVPVMAMAVVRGVGPLSDWAYVDVDELSGWVVADAACVEGLGCVAEDGGGDAVYAEINGFGDDVLRVFGGVGLAAFAELVVGFLGAVAGEDVDDAV